MLYIINREDTSSLHLREIDPEYASLPAKLKAGVQHHLPMSSK